MVKTRSRIHWRVLPPNKVHLNVQNVWVSNSVANNVDKLKYQSLVNMDGFGLKWNCDGFWWAVPQVIFLHKFSKLDLYSVYGYITTSPWLGPVHILRNTWWGGGGLPNLLQYYIGGSSKFITILQFWKENGRL